jgi:hypothetical protein
MILFIPETDAADETEVDVPFQLPAKWSILRTVRYKNRWWSVLADPKHHYLKQNLLASKAVGMWLGGEIRLVSKEEMP